MYYLNSLLNIIFITFMCVYRMSYFDVLVYIYTADLVNYLSYLILVIIAITSACVYRPLQSFVHCYFFLSHNNIIITHSERALFDLNPEWRPKGE